MNHAEMKAVATELDQLTGRLVGGIWQISRDRVVLELGRSMLLMVPRGPDARLHLIGERPAAPRRPFSFQGACRAHLAGPLREIWLHASDRILELRFDEASLHLRLIGPRGGLWLLRGAAVIAAYDGPAPARLPEPPPTPQAPPDARSPRFRPIAQETLNQAAERWFGERERARRDADRRRELGRRLGSQIARDQRLVNALHRDLEKAEKSDDARSKADSVASQLHAVQRGASSVTVTNPLDPSTTYEVELDPSRSPGQNLERLYARARRLERMGVRVLTRLDEVERRLRTMIAAKAVVGDADRATLDRIAALVPEPTQQRTSSTPSLPWWVWKTPSGHEILIGKNAKANRRLTFQKARGTDWWMHLRGRPGAHVIVRCNRGQVPDLDTLLGAAELIGRYARIDIDQRYEVQVARIRDVRSIPGAADGRVLVHDERVLEVVRDPSRVIGWRQPETLALDVDALRDAMDG